ncbi:MAG: hypothetical protein RBG13Loki_1751 [Promethearchaeota archaeon CR_4]|nr:MAG: hypothetical protein RBG13Loki_1751 [Candidatus Lokiarchaeota archaeon CR_4]
MVASKQIFVTTIKNPFFDVFPIELAMEYLDSAFLPIIPLPTAHTTEVVALFSVRGGFFTRDILGMIRVWDEEGIQRGIFPPVAATDFIIFPSVGGDYTCIATIGGLLRVYKCSIQSDVPQNEPQFSPFQLYSSGSFNEKFVTNWTELVTCGFASEDGKDIYIGTSSGGIYHAKYTQDLGEFKGTSHPLRPKDGFSCRGFTRNEAGSVFAVLQNGFIEELSRRRGDTLHRSYIGGHLGMVRVAPDADFFAGIRLSEGGILSSKEEDEIIICDAEGRVTHELRAPFVSTLTLTKDKLLIASDEEGLLEYDLEARELTPFFENDPWGEDFSVISLSVLPATRRIVVGGIDHLMNTSLLQVWEWGGELVTEKVRRVESLAALVPNSEEPGNFLAGTNSGGIWVIGGKYSRGSQFLNLPSSAEAVQILPVNDSSAIFLGNYSLKDLDLGDDSGVAWLVDLSRKEPVEELAVYEPLVGGWYDANSTTASIFSGGVYQVVNIPSFEILESDRSYPVDDPNFVASSVVKTSNSNIWFAGTERGEIWRFMKDATGEKIIDQSHSLGPIEALALGSLDAPLLIAGFYRVIGIFWPQNNGFNKIYGLNAAINALAPHPEFPLFACGALDGVIHLFDYNGYKIAMLSPRYGKVVKLFWSTGTQLVAGYASGEIGMWNLSSLPILVGNSQKRKK